MREVNKGGFTLIEILASIVLIAVALVPLMQILAQSLGLSMKEERLTKVIFLGERKMEEVRGKVTYDFDTSRAESAAQFLVPYDEYKYTVADDEGADIKVISVTVWHDEDDDDVVDNDEETITMDTRVADRS